MLFFIQDCRSILYLKSEAVGFFKLWFGSLGTTVISIGILLLSLSFHFKSVGLFKLISKFEVLGKSEKKLATNRITYLFMIHRKWVLAIKIGLLEFSKKKQVMTYYLAMYLKFQLCLRISENVKKENKSKKEPKIIEEVKSDELNGIDSVSDQSEEIDAEEVSDPIEKPAK